MASNVLGMAFVPYYNHLMQILQTNPDLKKSFQGIFHQVCYSAAGTVIGGVTFGPLGAAVGGAVGALLGYATVDNYDSLIKVLREMSDDDKRRLVQRVQELVGSTGIEALTNFIASQVNRDLFATVIRDFAMQVKAGG
jgi:hypothetical protein